ncbi:alcohol dehydrogenase class IV [Parageobacillus toebii NBRC 107807]|uniref:Alcohol dehydrogenase class IV n=1 Tax=Parageobacillus toebii NBRC 107807 TaxID=1223503 RepID=A0AA89NMT3_9BACL|nr:alcohol dehydrogenase class IV [Parageobacillus toebii NBRC 107807]
MPIIYCPMPKAYSNPEKIESRETMMTVSFMAGLAFGM